MKVTTSREITESAAGLCIIVSDPKNMPAWNEKCQAIKFVYGSCTGTRFKAQFAMRAYSEPD